MLSKLRLKTKIQLLPGLAGIAFLALIAINLSRGHENTARLEEIERGHFPALESSRDLVVLLDDTRRTFQDATTAQDLETLDKVKGLEVRFGESLDELERSHVVAAGKLAELRTSY